MIAATLQRAVDAFTKLHHDILVQLLPHGADLDPDVVDDLTNVTLTFINGLMLRFVHGDRIIDTPEQLDGVLSAIVAGVLAQRAAGATHPRRRRAATAPQNSSPNPARMILYGNRVERSSVSAQSRY